MEHRDSKELEVASEGRRARAWEVDLLPREVVSALGESPAFEARAVDEEDALEQDADGKLFIEVRDDEARIWRRPVNTILFALAHSQRVPYPDILRVRVRSAPHGSRVVATWERHPFTRAGALTLATRSIVAVALIVYLAAASGMLWLLVPLVLVAVAIPIGRFVQLRAFRAELLTATHALLAAHELGRAELEASAFRAGRRS